MEDRAVYLGSEYFIGQGDFTDFTARHVYDF